MKIVKLSICALLAATALWSCGNSDNKDGKDSKEVPEINKTDKDGNALAAFRYYDVSKVMSEYNLAKDYNEATMRLQRNFESTYKTRQASVQKAQEGFQTKLNGGQFATEAEAKAAYDLVMQQQANAASELDRLQRNSLEQSDRMSQEVQDSINSVLTYLGSAHKLDAIFAMSTDSIQSTNKLQYFNPDLDITDVVIEELNKRYTKVAD
ncbi:MAG: OmpH family outer membrane protein [Muribaculaceae bacterium]|nr:OmpH family outer membrane protein [Muribaculaceae bacterium]